MHSTLLAITAALYYILRVIANTMLLYNILLYSCAWRRILLAADGYCCHLQSAKFFSDDAAPSSSLLICPASDALELSQLIENHQSAAILTYQTIRDSTTVGLLIYFDGYRPTTRFKQFVKRAFNCADQIYNMYYYIIFYRP